MRGVIFVTALLSLGACKRKTASGAESPMTGDQIFSAICSRCHGPDGHGGVGNPAPRNFHDAAFQAARTDDDLKNDIRNGRNNVMPAFGTTFTDEQLRQLIAKVRSFDPTRGGSP